MRFNQWRLRERKHRVKPDVPNKEKKVELTMAIYVATSGAQE
jgi:hypothetical protein